MASYSKCCMKSIQALKEISPFDSFNIWSWTLCSDTSSLLIEMKLVYFNSFHSVIHSSKIVGENLDQIDSFHIRLDVRLQNTRWNHHGTMNFKWGKIIFHCTSRVSFCFSVVDIARFINNKMSHWRSIINHLIWKLKSHL